MISKKSKSQKEKKKSTKFGAVHRRCPNENLPASHNPPLHEEPRRAFNGWIDPDWRHPLRPENCIRVCFGPHSTSPKPALSTRITLRESARAKPTRYQFSNCNSTSDIASNCSVLNVSNRWRCDPPKGGVTPTTAT